MTKPRGSSQRPDLLGRPLTSKLVKAGSRAVTPGEDDDNNDNHKDNHKYREIRTI